MTDELKWPENIAAERHEVSKKWVLHYLTDVQAMVCNQALNSRPTEDALRARVKVLEDALREIIGLTYKAGYESNGWEYGIAKKALEEKL